MKRTIVLLATVGMMSLGAISPANAAGPGNGSEGCTLSNNSTYKNPAAMLKYLAERDGGDSANGGSFQNTVDKYVQFSSVGDLIGQKCGA